MKTTKRFTKLAAVIATMILTSCGGGKDESGKFTDKRDGQIYKTVKIGDQIWMAQNLNFAAKGSKCFGEGGTFIQRYPYEGDEEETISDEQIREICAESGRLYDWKTAKKAVPKGWHLPSKEEWETLLEFAGGRRFAGKELLNENGFSGSTPGLLMDDYFLSYAVNTDYWWSATENDDEYAYAFSIGYIYVDSDDNECEHDGCAVDVNGSSDVESQNKKYMFSVRLLKDAPKEKKQKKEKQEKQENEETAEETADEDAEETPKLEFDWTKMSELKNSTIERLKKKTKPQDKIITEFFKNYDELCGEVGSVLFSVYDDWELQNKILEDKVLANFVKEMEDNGMRLAQSDGTSYVFQDNNFIKKVLLPHVNPVSAQYINLYCDDRELTDGMMYYTLGVDETIDLVYRYGELSEKTDGLEYKDEVESGFNGYLGYLFSSGGEYQCAWNNMEDGDGGWVKIFDEGAYERLKQFVEEHPSSRAAKEFKPRLAALKKGNLFDFDYSADDDASTFLEFMEFTDSRDGQVYKIVKIGEQVWMAQNLNFAVQDNKCAAKDCEKYGRLYDWETAKKSCPAGWHLPADEEWATLVNAVGKETAGKKLKAASGWNDDEGKSGNGSDDFGFSALAGGFFDDDGEGGGFNNIGYSGYWWSATEYSVNDAYWRYMENDNDTVGRGATTKGSNMCARCVKD